MSPEQSVLCSVSSHFAERDIVRPGDAVDPPYAFFLAARNSTNSQVRRPSADAVQSR